jgi:hypothetical protein
MVIAFQILLFLILIVGVGLMSGKEYGKEDKDRGLSLSLASMAALVVTLVIV